MALEGFAEFFLAGAGDASVGLLFVAVSLGPEPTFGDPALAAPPRQQPPEGTLSGSAPRLKGTAPPSAMRSAARRSARR